MITKEISFFSPAKANLFFRVAHRREDGYHHIESLIQMLDFGDTLFFSLDTSKDHFTSTASYLLWNSDNLIYKTVALFRKTTGIKAPINIHLEKHIPAQAGLGGGSSNAATTLYALNQLFSTNLSDSELASLGSSLGADVPCFFGLGSVYVEGIGEKITCVDPMAQEYTIVKPYHVDLSTPLVYKHVNINMCTKIAGARLLASFATEHPLYINDLEHASFTLAPELRSFKEQLVRQGVKQIIMTGSGSAFIIAGKYQPIETLCFSQAAKPICRSKNSWYII